MTDTDWVRRGVRVTFGPEERESITSIIGNCGVVRSVSKGLALVRLDSGADVYLSVDRLRRPKDAP